jgi:hypothetical protein
LLTGYGVPRAKAKKQLLKLIAGTRISFVFYLFPPSFKAYLYLNNALQTR